VKIVTIVGARPQFIKAAPVSRALREQGLEEFLLHTGQHYDLALSQVFFDELDLQPPEANLEVGSGRHGEQTAAMLAGIERCLIEQKPDWVLIYGDTNSTVAGALAAVKLHLPVAHVEAGLRSFNRRMPEEINRIVADAVADLLFLPTATARTNLEREGVPEERMVWTGDVMYDAALQFREKALRVSRALERLELAEGGYVLSTVHRAENTDDPARLRAILDGLALAAETLPVVLPLHPRTRAALERHNLEPPARVRIIEPVGFLDMVRLEAGARVVATDSGGVQKEAFFHGAPCVTLREETEWTELVEAGWNRLCPPTDADAVAAAIREAAASQPPRQENFYGDGRASHLIAESLSARRA
jgi:UDP-GlcNAc3NAcA epimerase